MEVSLQDKIRNFNKYHSDIKKELKKPEILASKVAREILEEKNRLCEEKEKNFNQAIGDLTKEIAKWKKKKKTTDLPLTTDDIKTASEKLQKRDKRLRIAAIATVIVGVTLIILGLVSLPFNLGVLPALGVSTATAANITFGVSLGFSTVGGFLCAPFFGEQGFRSFPSNHITEDLKDFVNTHIRTDQDGKQYYLHPKHLTDCKLEELFFAYRRAVDTLPQPPAQKPE